MSIASDRVVKVNSFEFWKSITLSRPEFRPFLAPHSLFDLQDAEGNGTIFYLLPEFGRAGFGIAPDGEIVLVHNNSGRPGLASILIDRATQFGGTYLTCFDGYLSVAYARAGFIETDRISWDDTYAPKGWDYHTYGRPDVLTMKPYRCV